MNHVVHRPPSTVHRQAQGVTLMELLIASSIGLVILLAMAHVDVTRIRVGKQATDIAEVQAEPAFAVTHLARSITKADRVELLNAACDAAANPGSCVKLRLPPTAFAADLDNPTAYTWVQYRLDGTTLRYFDSTNPCTEQSRFANIASLTLQRHADNNIFEMTVTSMAADPQTGEAVQFTGQATMRASFSDLNPNRMTGLLPSGVGDAPASC